MITKSLVLQKNENSQLNISLAVDNLTFKNISKFRIKNMHLNERLDKPILLFLKVNINCRN